MSESAEQSRVLTLVFTDLADSTALKTARGDSVVNALLMRHRAHVEELSEQCAGRIVDWAGDGCFLTFETSSAAVMFALRLQQTHATEADLPGVRIGVHLGEITEGVAPDGSPQVKGLAVDVAARVEGLAKPGQILMSASVHDSARQRLGIDALGEPILWQAHGSYKLKGVDRAYEISEAGLKGVAPMSAPKVGDKARRVKRLGRRNASPARERSLPDITRQFRTFGYVLVGFSLVMFYVALQFKLTSDLLGFFLASFFGGSAALFLSGSAFRRHRKRGDLGNLPALHRAWSWGFIRFGGAFILLGALLSPLAGNLTFYVLAMIGLPFFAIGCIQFIFARRTRRFGSGAKSTPG